MASCSQTWTLQFVLFLSSKVCDRTLSEHVDLANEEAKGPLGSDVSAQVDPHAECGHQEVGNGQVDEQNVGWSAHALADHHDEDDQSVAAHVHDHGQHVGQDLMTSKTLSTTSAQNFLDSIKRLGEADNQVVRTPVSEAAISTVAGSIPEWCSILPPVDPAVQRVPQPRRGLRWKEGVSKATLNRSLNRYIIKKRKERAAEKKKKIRKKINPGWKNKS